MRYLFLIGLIVISVLAAIVDAANANQQQTSNQVHRRNKSIKPASLALHHNYPHRSSKPIAKQRKAVAKSNRNVAKKSTANKKAKGVLVNRNGKRRRAIVKSKPRRKAVRAIRKISRRVNRVKPSSRSKSIKRRASSPRKRLAKQEEADIENSEGFGEEQQNVDNSSTSGGSGSSTSDTSGTSSTSDQQPAADQPASTPEETPAVESSQPASTDTANQSPAIPQSASNLPSNFNINKLSNASGKNAVGVGYASNSNGPSVAFGYATSINGQNSAGGFGASFSTPDLLNAAQPAAASDQSGGSTSTQQEGSTDELAQYRRRPR